MILGFSHIAHPCFKVFALIQRIGMVFWGIFCGSGIIKIINKPLKKVCCRKTLSRMNSMCTACHLPCEVHWWYQSCEFLIWGYHIIKADLAFLLQTSQERQRRLFHYPHRSARWHTASSQDCSCNFPIVSSHHSDMCVASNSIRECGV